MRNAARRSAVAILLPVIWIVCATLLALGSAGIVTGMAHQPGTPSRAELTYGADIRIAPGLAESADALRKLTTDVDGLGSLGTDALTAVTGGDAAAMQTAIASGRTLIATIDSETAALRARLATLPGVGPGAEGRLGGLQLQRYQTLTGALDATGELGSLWDQLTTGSLAAVQLETTLLDHDASTGAAARFGVAARYADALAQLGTSDAKIADARRQRDLMSATVDVAVLTDWIDRTAAYDAALRKLYSLLLASHGKVTKAVQAAYEAQKVAQKALPGDSRGLVVIMADVARGVLNRAVIAIEDAKGQLSDAVDAFDAADATGAPGSGGLPSAAP